MDGLISNFGYMSVGGQDRYGGDDDEEKIVNSKSSWAEVVSSEKEEDRDRDRDDQKDNKTEEQEANNGGWETINRHKPQRHLHKVLKHNWEEYKHPANEQRYSDDIEIDKTQQPTEEELSDLSIACNKLWELDTNRLIPGKDYEIDCGEGKRANDKQDKAGDNLFSWVNDDVFRKPTVARFCSLLDNYNPHQGYKEVITEAEKQEEIAFIEEISRTSLIKYLHKYLSYKNVVSEDYQEFKNKLRDLWFDLYDRSGTSDSSSAFEHVFVGEIKDRGSQKVSGFHNWIQFYLEESKGNVDYQGYIFPKRRGEIPDTETQLLTIQFEWNGVLKSISSTLVGVSPEFEIGVYTLCFFLGQQDNYIQIGPYNVNVKCYHLGDQIGSIFPVAE